MSLSKMSATNPIWLSSLKLDLNLHHLWKRDHYQGYKPECERGCPLLRNTEVDIFNSFHLLRYLQDSTCLRSITKIPLVKSRGSCRDRVSPFEKHRCERCQLLRASIIRASRAHIQSYSQLAYMGCDKYVETAAKKWKWHFFAQKLSCSDIIWKRGQCRWI